MISFRFFLMLPVLETRLLNFGLDHGDFFLMVLGATIIAAAGNLINDYFDRESDRHNHKSRPGLPENVFWTVYWSMNGVGLSLCTWSAWQAGLVNLTLLPLGAVFLLFRYSEQWKKQGWLGPVVIVFLCMVWVAMPWLYEFKAMGILFQYYRTDSNVLHQTWLIYLLFCALVTLSRELLKACEDFDGDLVTETHTVAVLHGPRWIGRIALALWVLVWGLNTFITFYQWSNHAMLEAAYSSVALGWSSFILWKLLTLSNGTPSKHVYRNLSLWIKIYFAMGILSIWIFYMIFLYGTAAT